jgi:hypothetical protein
MMADFPLDNWMRTGLAVIHIDNVCKESIVKLGLGYFLFPKKRDREIGIATRNNTQIYK